MVYPRWREGEGGFQKVMSGSDPYEEDSVLGEGDGRWTVGMWCMLF